MSHRPQPDCVLDWNEQPTVMRCKHCGSTEPVALPMEMGALVKLSKVFEQAHGLCHLSLTALRSRMEVLEDLPPPTTNSARTRRRVEMKRVYRAIKLREAVNLKKRLKN